MNVALRQFSCWELAPLDGPLGGTVCVPRHRLCARHNSNKLAVLMPEDFISSSLSLCLSLFQDQKNAPSLFPYPGEFLHPVVYACTALMLLCLIASIITYILHHSTIRISRTGWHILLNLCFHMALTFSVFAGGINRITHTLICQSVAVVLHYSSLSAMLWLAATSQNIYKQARKDPGQAPKGENTNPAARSPVIRFYLVCAGLPLIICGITASISLENYGSTEQMPLCWMAWEPSLGAFFSPVCLVLLGACIYLLMSFWTLNKHPDRKYELKSTAQVRGKNTFPELRRTLTPCFGRFPLIEPPTNSGQCHSGCSGLLPHPSSSSLANEHTLKAQLCSTSFTLLLFSLSWIFGVLSVTLWDFLGMIFSCLYGASSVTLGLFILIHHCAKRDDVWSCWTSCCLGHQKNTCHHPTTKLNELSPVSQYCARLQNDATLNAMLQTTPEMHLHPCVMPIRTKNSIHDPECMNKGIHCAMHCAIITIITIIMCVVGKKMKMKEKMFNTYKFTHARTPGQTRMALLKCCPLQVAL
ncbi:hypothetical protein DNTS_029301 [Danionella cerebrum]|uniref:G-protein coupled receptors family 2 profile 2 domain-containing protein n=1 Tax=Danionella cerebrum TaxID=2873325 RepID=A0A553QGH8_9TELE|nr:hypothetical protein DNTS_029301 [Danionella translucida]